MRGIVVSFRNVATTKEKRLHTYEQVQSVKVVGTNSIKDRNQSKLTKVGMALTL